MDTRLPGLALPIALVLAACGDPPSDDEQLAALPAEDVHDPAGMPAVAEPNDGYPDLTPASLTPEAERGVKGATNVMLSWARAIELEEFDQAWAMMSAADRAKWPRGEWAKMFSGLSNITVAVTAGTIEGAAGSSYYTAPVTITATDPGGRPVRYEGKAVLRRVNDVPGASPQQLRWHIEGVSLDWTH